MYEDIFFFLALMGFHIDRWLNEMQCEQTNQFVYRISENGEECSL